MILIDRLSLRLGGFALCNIDLSIPTGEYFVLVGPTGAGKSLLLESIAGLHHIDEGAIWLDGSEVTALEPEARGVSIVYQDYALFPHLSVEENVAFGLKMRRRPRKEIAAALASIVSLFGIHDLLCRKPRTLSGGERQKVALARALITRPAVLLLDEPLAALDPLTREGVQADLRRLHSLFGTTTLHVTHDFDESMALGERIGVMGGGRLWQIGTPEDIFRRPSSEFVARFTLSHNVFSGQATLDGGSSTFTTQGMTLSIPPRADGPCSVCFRPEDVLISREPFPDNQRNCFRGVIAQVIDKGAMVQVDVDLPPVLRCLVPRRSTENVPLPRGNHVWLAVDEESIHAF
jgi:molybdate transport system ATP-binding protein/molybdate/tungstate transport system ATP-binding protein